MTKQELTPDLFFKLCAQPAVTLNLPKQGDGIILRDFRSEDAESLADIEYDPAVKKYLSLPSQDRAEWISTFSRIEGCAVESLPERILAGQANISSPDTLGEGELRIVIAKKFWGDHLGRKVAALIIPAAFEEMHVESVLATVHPDNSASLALVESCDFTYRGKKEGKQTHWQTGHLIYELTRAAYYSSLPEKNLVAKIENFGVSV